jgi:cell division protein FtsL
MMENRGNAARAVSFEETAARQKRRRLSQAKGIPAGEKLLYLFSVVICVALATLVISRYAEVTELNVEIQKVEEEAKRIEEINRQLETEKKMLSSGERIRQFAEMRGMIPAENVKPFPSLTGREDPEKRAARDKRG